MDEWESLRKYLLQIRLAVNYAIAFIEGMQDGYNLNIEIESKKK